MEYIQIWTPDTCECALHQAIDEDKVGTQELAIRFVTPDEAADLFAAYRAAKPNNSIPMTKDEWKKAHGNVKLCKAHEVHGHTKARYDAVMNDNRKKNVTFAVAAGVSTDVTPDTYKWLFDADRNLQVTFTHKNVTADMKNQIQAACDLQFGNGKVKVG